MATEIFKVVGRLVMEGVDTVEKGFKNAEKFAKDSEKSIKKFGKAMEKAGESMETAGKSMSEKVTAPLAALGGAALLSASQMETAQARIQGQLGLSEEAAAELMQTAKSLWADGFGENVGEVADGLAVVGQNLQDLPADQLEAVSKQAFILQDLFGFELNESTRTANTLMKTFGIEAGEAFDIMAAGAQQGANINGDLLDVLNEYGPQFAAMGYSSEEFLGTLIAGSDSGAFSLDKLGDAAKESFLLISSGSDETNDALTELGLNAGQVVDDINSGGEDAQKAFMAVTSAIAGVEDPSDRARLAIELMGVPLEDLGPQFQTFFATAKTDVEGLEGAATRAGEGLEQAFGTRVQGFFREIAIALEPLGQTLMDLADSALPAISQGIEKLSNWFGSLSEENQKWIVILGLAAAAAGPILIVVGQLIGAFGNWLPVIARVVTGFNPWIAVIVGVIAMLASLYAKSEEFRTIVNTVFGVALQLLIGTFQYYWGLAKQIWDSALNVIMGLVNTFKGLFTGNWSQMWDGILQLLQGALGLIWSFIQITILGRIMGAFRSFGSGAKNIVKDLGDKASGFISTMVNKMKSKFDDVFTAGKNKFSSLKDAITKPINDAKDKISGIIDKIKGFFNNLKLKIPSPSLPPMPHFEITTKSKTIMGKKITYPTGFDVNWYDKGGIFTGPQIIGVGEKRPEFVGALDDLRGIVSQAMGDYVQQNGQPATAAQASGGDTFNIHIDPRNIQEFNDLVSMVYGFRASVRGEG